MTQATREVLVAQPLPMPEPLRHATAAEWDEWFMQRWDRPRCEIDPRHLVGSYAHRVECEGWSRPTPKPTYQELEARVAELEGQLAAIAAQPDAEVGDA